MRSVVGVRARDHTAASTSGIVRFETEALSPPTNLKRLIDLSGRWIDRTHHHRPERDGPLEQPGERPDRRGRDRLAVPA
jgi:hypothetical protein